MATYRYKCPGCSDEFEIIKRIAQADDLESCPFCKIPGITGHHRMLGALTFMGEKPEEAFYAPALGKMVSGKTEMRRIAKDKGMIEVGTENVDRTIDRHDNEREQKSQDRWAEFSKPIEVSGR